MTQPTLWSAGAREPAVTDLEGLLAGPGHISVRGDLARIGVVVDRIRAERLADLLAVELGLETELTTVSDEDGLAVRTPWLAELRPVARGWQHGSVTRPPAGWSFDGARLRWWCLAAGSADGVASYRLLLSATNDSAWPGVGAAMSASGVSGAFIGPRAGGPAYRVVGQRRVQRLRELVGDPPAGVLPSDWPPPPAHRPPMAL